VLDAAGASTFDVSERAQAAAKERWTGDTASGNEVRGGGGKSDGKTVDFTRNWGRDLGAGEGSRSRSSDSLGGQHHAGAEIEEAGRSS